MSPTTTLWIIFKTCSHIQSTISRHAPPNQCFIVLWKTFHCKNNNFMVIYWVKAHYGPPLEHFWV
jgi:hypothetical protein